MREFQQSGWFSIGKIDCKRFDAMSEDEQLEWVQRQIAIFKFENFTFPSMLLIAFVLYVIWIVIL